MRVLSSGSGAAGLVGAVQLAIALITGLVAAIFWGPGQMKAALFGGAIAVVPTLYMTLRLFPGRQTRTPEESLAAFYRGEIGKFALTAVMFWFGVRFFAQQFLAVLLAYIACLLAYWLVFALAGISSNKKTSD